MRVLVTGATGFVGAHLVRRLLDERHEVAALIRTTSDTWRLTGVIEHVSVIHGDLGQPETWLDQVVRFRPDVCAHLAWYAEPGTYLESAENISCLASGLSLLEALAAANCARVVMTGTCAEYAHAEQPLNESSPIGPTTLYAACKLALSTVATQRARQLGMQLAWARLFYLYGPREDPRRLVPAVIKALSEGRPFAATTGHQVRDYLHIDDVASALCALTESPACGVFNVSSAEPVRIAGLLNLIADILDRPGLIRFGELPGREGDPPFLVGEHTRLRAATNWTPRRNLRDGLASTIEWWSRLPDPAN